MKDLRKFRVVATWEQEVTYEVEATTERGMREELRQQIMLAHDDSGGDGRKYVTKLKLVLD